MYLNHDDQDDFDTVLDQEPIARPARSASKPLAKSAVRDDEITLAEAIPLLGMNALNAARYLREKGIAERKAVGSYLREQSTWQSVEFRYSVNAYPRDAVLAVAKTLKKDLAAIRADREARRLASLRTGRLEKAERASMSTAPYVVLADAAVLIGKRIDDPLFDEDERFEVYTDPNGTRWFSRDALERFAARTGGTDGKRHTSTPEEAAREDMRRTIALYDAVARRAANSTVMQQAAYA